MTVLHSMDRTRENTVLTVWYVADRTRTVPYRTLPTVQVRYRYDRVPSGRGPPDRRIPRGFYPPPFPPMEFSFVVVCPSSSSSSVRNDCSTILPMASTIICVIVVIFMVSYSYSGGDRGCSRQHYRVICIIVVILMASYSYSCGDRGCSSVWKFMYLMSKCRDVTCRLHVDCVWTIPLGSSPDPPTRIDMGHPGWVESRRLVLFG